MIRAVLEQSAGVAAAQPVADNRVAILHCLRQSKLFRDYQQAFESTTGFPLVLRAAGSFQVPLEGSKRTNPFCALMTGANKSCSACLQFQRQAEAAAAGKSITLQCYAGLSESMVPVRIGHHVLGYLQTGQVLLTPPSLRHLARLVSAPLGLGTAVDRRALESAYFQTRVIRPEQYRSIIQLLVTFAEHLAMVSNQLLMNGSTIDSPWNTKIRAFIANHQEEELGLEVVARAMNMSSFYFCKLFKRATGLTFTEYLARARVEAVKKKLQNIHLRVSEAAFAAGFQSLSQFNRVFRRVAGEAPTLYRARLHGSAAKTVRSAVRPRRIAVG